MGGWIGCWCGGGRLGGGVAMETNRSVSEAVAVGGDDSTLAARKELAAIGHPGAAGHLGESETDQLTEVKVSDLAADWSNPSAEVNLNQFPFNSLA